MSIFGKIMSAIFGSSASATPAGGASAPAGGGGGAAAAPAAKPAQTVDVAPILDKAVAAKHEKLEWRTSIVDLMKALDIDSSLSARKELAKELGYHRRHQRLRQHECLAAQAGDGQARGQWRQAAARDQALIEISVYAGERPVRPTGLSCAQLRHEIPIFRVLVEIVDHEAAAGDDLVPVGADQLQRALDQLRRNAASA